MRTGFSSVAFSFSSASSMASTLSQARWRCSGDVERRVPEGHDRIADIFVDGRAPLHQDVGHRRQEIVEEDGELGRLHRFRDRGEGADVAEQDGEFAVLAAEHQRVWIFDQLLDHGRREIVVESVAYVAALAFAEQQPDARRDAVGEQTGLRRQDGRQEQVVIGEGEPADADAHGKSGRSDRCVGEGRQPGQEGEHQEAKANRHNDLEADRPVGPGKESAR